jgi:hypothetical protein
MVGGSCYYRYYWINNLFDMQIEGTRQAFEAMLQERGIYKRLGVDTSTVANWKTYLRQGKSISLDKMEEMLIKAGAIMLQEKIWSLAPVELSAKNINPRELRIGNYLSVQGLQISVSITDFQRLLIPEMQLEFMGLYKAIPLTEEWLLRCGFRDFRLLLPGDGELEIRLKGNTFHIWPTDGQTESHNYRNHIYFLHQLQNIYFALTGEELTIKENAHGIDM